MNKILLLFLLFNSSLQAEDLSGYYVTKNSDTVHCVFNLQKRHKQFYDFSTVAKAVILKDNEGVKKFKPYEINCFVIELPHNETCKFVSLPEDKKLFFHEIIKGDISLYKTYSRHPYDGSLTIIPIAYKENKLIYLNVLNRKKQIGDLLKDKPIVFKKWETTKFNAWTGTWFDTTKIEEYIREYNEL